MLTMLPRTIASEAMYCEAGNASEGVGSAWLVRSLDSSTVGDTSPRDAFPASSGWFAQQACPTGSKKDGQRR